MFIIYISILANGRDGCAKLLGYNLGSLLSCGNYGGAEWHLVEKRCDIGLLYYFEELVRGVILGSAHHSGCIIEGYVLSIAELSNALGVEGFCVWNFKVVFVAKEYKPHNSPHIVNPIWVEKLH